MDTSDDKYNYDTTTSSKPEHEIEFYPANKNKIDGDIMVETVDEALDAAHNIANNNDIAGVDATITGVTKSEPIKISTKCKQTPSLQKTSQHQNKRRIDHA